MSFFFQRKNSVISPCVGFFSVKSLTVHILIYQCIWISRTCIQILTLLYIYLNTSQRNVVFQFRLPGLIMTKFEWFIVIIIIMKEDYRCFGNNESQVYAISHNMQFHIQALWSSASDSLIIFLKYLFISDYTNKLRSLEATAVVWRMKING